MRPERTFKIAPNWLYIGRMTVTYNLPTWRHPKVFFDVAVFLLSGLVTGPSFMAMSLLGMELRQFSFIADWPKIWKSEIPLSEFCPISGDRGELRIPNFGRMFLMASYRMLQNCRVTAFTVSELIRENQQGSKNTPIPLPTQWNNFLHTLVEYGLFSLFLQTQQCHHLLNLIRHFHVRPL